MCVLGGGTLCQVLKRDWGKKGRRGAQKVCKREEKKKERREGKDYSVFISFMSWEGQEKGYIPVLFFVWVWIIMYMVSLSLALSLSLSLSLSRSLSLIFWCATIDLRQFVYFIEFCFRLVSILSLFLSLSLSLSHVLPPLFKLSILCCVLSYSTSFLSRHVQEIPRFDSIF